MAVRNRTPHPIGDLVFAVVWFTAIFVLDQSVGPWRIVMVAFGVLILLRGLRGLWRRAGTVDGPPSAATPPVTPTVTPETVGALQRLRRLSTEAVMPGGRSTQEVLQEAAHVFEQLPPDVRRRIDEEQGGERWFNGVTWTAHERAPETH